MRVTDADGQALHDREVQWGGALVSAALAPAARLTSSPHHWRQSSHLLPVATAHVNSNNTRDTRHTNKKVKLKASHTGHRALGPELIPVYSTGSQPAGDYNSSTRR